MIACSQYISWIDIVEQDMIDDALFLVTELRIHTVFLDEIFFFSIRNQEQCPELQMKVHRID